MQNFDQSLQPFTGCHPTSGSTSHSDLPPRFYPNSPGAYAFPPPSGSPSSSYAHYPNLGASPFHNTMDNVNCGPFSSPQAHFSNTPYSNFPYTSQTHTPHGVPDFRLDRRTDRFASTPSFVSSRGLSGVTDESFWASNDSGTRSHSSRTPVTPARNYWIARALSDPWSNITTVQTPSPDCLVSRPIPQRHTILFTPRELRRKAQPDDQPDEVECYPKRFSYQSPPPLEHDAPSPTVVVPL